MVTALRYAVEQSAKAAMLETKVAACVGPTGEVRAGKTTSFWNVGFAIV
jgi:hypothetical protein